MTRRFTALAQRNDQAGLRLQALRPQLRLERGRHRMVLLELRLRSTLRRRLDQQALSLQGLARALNSVSPFATLARGYAIVRDPSSGAALRSSRDARIGQDLDAQLAEGVLRVTVTGLKS
jgi:exodeoxyribonuclease VII large subunit